MCILLGMSFKLMNIIYIYIYNCILYYKQIYLHGDYIPGIPIEMYFLLYTQLTQSF